MDNKVKEAVERYQCSGCVTGSDTTCYLHADDLGCVYHVVGTSLLGVGNFYLGMPRGFDRLGMAKTPIQIFKTLKYGWKYGKFNAPVWKYLDNYGNTLVRGIMPRLNLPFLHIFLGDFMKDIDCIEITAKDMEEMD